MFYLNNPDELKFIKNKQNQLNLIRKPRIKLLPQMKITTLNLSPSLTLAINLTQSLFLNLNYFRLKNLFNFLILNVCL